MAYNAGSQAIHSGPAALIAAQVHLTNSSGASSYAVQLGPRVPERSEVTFLAVSGLDYGNLMERQRLSACVTVADA